MPAVKATDLVPEAYADGGATSRPDDLDYDLRHLTATDGHAIDPASLRGGGAEAEAELQALATEATQLLVAQLFALQREPSAAGPLALLPAGTTALPRQQRLPEKKAPTRWEQYAAAKGIVNRKRDRMVWDETLQKWAPRWGYKRANDETDVPIVVLKPQDDGSADQFAELRKAKKQRVEKNKAQQARNLQEGNAAVPAGLPLDLIQQKRGKANTRKALRLSQEATASMGKFDQRRVGEPERKARTARRKYKSVTAPADTATEKRIIDSILGTPSSGGGSGGGGGGGSAPKGGAKKRTKGPKPVSRKAARKLKRR